MSLDDRERFTEVLRGDGGSAEFTLETLCEGVATLLPVSGASLVLMSHGAAQGVAGSLLGLAKALQDLEFTLGEGPGVTAFRQAEPVCVDELQSDDGRWPLFSDMASKLGAGSIYGLPLRSRADTLGVLTLCSERPRALQGSSLGDALLVAELVTQLVLSLQGQNVGEPLARPLDASDLRAVVHQATGMISAQLGCPVDEALIRLRGHAFATEWPIDRVAEAVIKRQIRFDEL